LRLVALTECGTHAMFAVSMGAYGDSEQVLARALVGALRPSMLVLADRGFTAHPLFCLLAATGADLCWRAKNNAALPVLERFPDGSYRSEIVASDDRRARRNVLTARVIEYTLDDPGRPSAKSGTGWSPRSSTGRRAGRGTGGAVCPAVGVRDRAG
jgi:hypothetical protein